MKNSTNKSFMSAQDHVHTDYTDEYESYLQLHSLQDTEESANKFLTSIDQHLEASNEL